MIICNLHQNFILFHHHPLQKAIIVILHSYSGKLIIKLIYNYLWNYTKLYIDLKKCGKSFKTT